MTAPGATADRLLTALEELVAQECVLMQARDFPGAVAIQERTAALVAELAARAGDAAVAALRPRVAAVIARREENIASIEVQRVRWQAERCRIDEARARLARIAPVYRGNATSAPRFNTAA